MEIVNLTPHPLNIHLPSGEVKTYEPTGEVARVKTSSRQGGEVDGCPLFVTEYGDVEGLPPPQEGVRFVVSRMIAAACPERTDLLVPSGLVRNEAGQIIGAKGFEAPNT